MMLVSRLDCVSGAGGCNLNLLWNNLNDAEGQIVNLEFEPVAYHLSEPFVFDGTTHASDVRLEGHGSTTLRRQSFVTTRRGLTVFESLLLTVHPSSPKVILRGFVLEGQVAIEGGELILEDCTFQNSDAASGGALMVHGGSVKVRRTNLLNNRAAADGGAVYIDGGHASFDRCLFEANVADRGGALYVSNGTVELSDESLLRGNRAAQGKTFFHNGGSVRYTLPTPLGRWINADTRKAYQSIPFGPTNLDYPYARVPPPRCSLHLVVSSRPPCSSRARYACAPGLFGEGYEVDVQTSAQCTGECGKGFFCPVGSSSPRICGRGSFCPGYGTSPHQRLNPQG